MKKFLTAIILGVMLALLLSGCSGTKVEETAEETVEYESGDFKYTLLKDGTAKITYYSGEGQTIEIPDTLDGKKVTAIGEYVFFH